MVLLAVAGAGVGCILPVDQAVGAVLGGGGHGFGKPGVESLGRDLGTGAEEPQVVVAEAGADDEDAFVAQGGEGAAEGEVLLRAVAVTERDLEQRDRGVGIHDVGGDEGAVVVALLGVEPDGRPAALIRSCAFCARSGAPGALYWIWNVSGGSRNSRRPSGGAPRT